MQRPAVADRDQVIHALETLTRAEMYMLREYARRLCWHCPDETDDLLQDAIRRTLAGAGDGGSGRRWYLREGNTMVIHLCGVMMSLADNHRKSWWRRIQLGSTSDVPDGQEENEPVNRLAASADHPADVIASRELREEIRRLLDGDVIAQQVVACKELGMVETEIQEVLNISEAVFEAARKRISRRLAHLRAGRRGHTELYPAAGHSQMTGIRP
ncbi:MAG: RNA polymerase sigma factor [Blastocatellia bacterium]